MKNRKPKSVSFNFVGAFAFFSLVAVLMQIAILVYDYIRERTDNVILIAILILILIVILSAFCTVFDYFRRKITIERPTKKILDATEKIAKGDFNAKLDIVHEYDKYTEYDYIMENLNKMASELQKNEVLKVDFISSVSHEIKTPLAIIQNYASLLQDQTLDAETRKSHAKTVENATKRLAELVSNILKLNKLENQEIGEKNEVFNLTEALSESVIAFEPIIEQRNLNLDCDFDDIIAFSSRSLLELVWNNLISNAIKFTSDGGDIKISLKRLGLDAEIKVQDSGIGISKEVGARIFEKFYQGDTSHSNKGNGLGLALVKKVVDVLGGEISVESELGKGSTFTVVFKGVVNED